MGPLRAIARLFAPAPDRPPLADGAQVRRLYRRWRWSVFCGITVGYGFFYTTRLSFSVAKKPLLDGGVLDARQMGVIGFALLLAYAAGKLANGFIADRVSPRRFFACGLLVSAVTNIAFGATSSYGLFVALWAVNGWVQSLGSPTSGVLMTNWFSHRERGTRYGVWSISHNIGEGITFLLTALLVQHAGWRWGFLGPGLLCAALVVLFYHLLADRPGALGLPAVAEYRADRPIPEAERRSSLRALQWAVLTDMRIWILGLASASMYVSRYAINNWGVLYLQIDRGCSLAEAGFVVSLFPVVGVFGSALSGVISDRLFRARRAPATLGYGLLFVVALCGVFFGPPAHIWLLRISMGAAGFAVGGLMVFLGGLTALDLCSKRTAGTAMGLIGCVSYIGAAAQDWLSGALIESTRAVVDGQVVYDFGRVRHVWVGAAALSLVLATSLWRAERRDERPGV
jgi:OPA family sugar phosphate sensor protein UhpC-like MFS transporter